MSSRRLSKLIARSWPSQRSTSALKRSIADDSYQGSSGTNGAPLVLDGSLNLRIASSFERFSWLDSALLGVVVGNVGGPEGAEMDREG